MTSQSVLSGVIEKPIILITEPVFTASLYAKVPAREIQTEMGQMLNEISNELKKQDVRPTGPWFTHHFHSPAEYFDFEVCFPVATTIKPGGRVTPGLWAAMKVVRTVYRGPYHGLAAAWGEFMVRIENLGLQVSSEIWEVYRVGPESERDPNKWHTELYRAVI